VTYGYGVSNNQRAVHVNMKDMKQMIKPWAAGIFATCSVLLASLDNQSHIPAAVAAIAAFQGTQVQTPTQQRLKFTLLLPITRFFYIFSNISIYFTNINYFSPLVL